MTIDWQPLQQIIDQNQSFLLTSHCRADCDALGSELAMAEILEQLGKKVRIVNGDEVPRHISFIDSNGRIETLGDGVTAANLTDLDVLMVLDTSARWQLGPMAEVLKQFSGTRVVMDHHVSQDDMEATVFKDSAAEATGRLGLGAWQCHERHGYAVDCSPIIHRHCDGYGLVSFRFGHRENLPGTGPTRSRRGQPPSNIRRSL